MGGILTSSFFILFPVMNVSMFSCIILINAAVLQVFALNNNCESVVK